MKIFFNNENESDSPIKYLSNDTVWFVEVSFILQKLSMGMATPCHLPLLFCKSV